MDPELSVRIARPVHATTQAGNVTIMQQRNKKVFLPISSVKLWTGRGEQLGPANRHLSHHCASLNAARQTNFLNTLFSIQ